MLPDNPTATLYFSTPVGASNAQRRRAIHPHLIAFVPPAPFDLSHAREMRPLDRPARHRINPCPNSVNPIPAPRKPSLVLIVQFLPSCRTERKPYNSSFCQNIGACVSQFWREPASAPRLCCSLERIGRKLRCRR